MERALQSTVLDSPMVTPNASAANKAYLEGPISSESPAIQQRKRFLQNLNSNQAPKKLGLIRPRLCEQGSTPERHKGAGSTSSFKNSSSYDRSSNRRDELAKYFTFRDGDKESRNSTDRMKDDEILAQLKSIRFDPSGDKRDARNQAQRDLLFEALNKKIATLSA